MLRIPNIKRFAIVGIGLGIAAVFFYQYKERTRRLPEGLIQANGRIEGDSVIIASKHPGRITAIEVREGDIVQAGQLLITLDDQAARARVAQATAALEAARAQVVQGRAELHLLGKEVPNSIESARAAVAAAKATLRQAQVTQAQALRERDRYRGLVEKGVVDEETAERSYLRWQQANAENDLARATVRQAQERLRDANLGQRRISVKEAYLGTLLAAEAGANARLSESQSALDDLTIVSPAAGSITTRLADVGEVVNAGAPLYELVDLDNLFLKVFIPETKIGRVRRRLPARIYVDAFPNEPTFARVRYIASRAEFTPKEIQTPEERVKLVYAVKLYLDENPQHRLTPGLPADAMIRWKEDVQWAKPRW